MSHGKQFTLYTHKAGPNGWKVVIVLEELGLAYESLYLDLHKGEQKDPEHTKYNPNGRIPTLIDHEHDDFVVWESNAIIAYLVDKYDTEHKISVVKFEEKIIQLQWLFFQASGQGPYFGQLAFFVFHSKEKHPSVIERYKNEIIRVFEVLESVLDKQEWLIGGKCTVADLSFLMWDCAALSIGVLINHEFDLEKNFPAVHKWHTAMLARYAVKKTLAVKESLSN
ncbi:Glutathione S-transferase 2 [Grifola frondosa]|uniref:glutathione transferase n=1 Tax=Grifola frondosa TaxID=5627 RepID=A0A1C7MGV7_GRIFR|nr:Glutathione S-transferase 2 [Grifola frondosa]